MREERLKQVLDRIADVSGGRTFYTDRIEQPEGVFNEIGEDIASQYLLAYVSSNERTGRWRNVNVRVNRPGLTVRTKQGYFAGS